MPDVTSEELNIAIDSTNFSLVQSTILELSGYAPKEKDPNEQVATETQATQASETIHLPDQSE